MKNGLSFIFIYFTSLLFFLINIGCNQLKNKQSFIEGTLIVQMSINGLVSAGPPTFNIIYFLKTDDYVYKLNFQPETELHIDKSIGEKGITIHGSDNLGDITLYKNATYRIAGSISENSKNFQELPVREIYLTYFEFLKPATHDIEKIKIINE